MYPSEIQAIIDNDVRQALAQQQAQIQSQINLLTERVVSIQVQVPPTVMYQKVSVTSGVRCDVPLDIMKSVPEFSGAQDVRTRKRLSAQY